MTYNPTPEQMEQDRIAMEMGEPPPNAPLVVEPPPPEPSPEPVMVEPPESTEPTPLTDADKTDLENQINYWETQKQQANDLLNSTTESPYEADQLDTQQVQKDINNYQAKIDLIQQHIDYGVTPSEEVQIIVSTEMQPFVTLDKDTSVIDVQGSLTSGINPDRLVELGVDRDYIAKLQALQELIGYKTSGGGYYLDKAIEDGKESTLLAAGFEQKDIAEAKKLKELADYKRENGYDIESAIKDGKIDVVRAAGFNPQDTLDAQIAVARTPKERFDDLQQSGDIPKDAEFIGVDKDGKVQYSTKTRAEDSTAQTATPQPNPTPQSSPTYRTGGHEIDTANEQIVVQSTQNAYDTLGKQFQVLPGEVQQDLIAEAFYNQKNTAQKSYSQLTDKQKQTVIDYYVGGLLSKEDLAKYEGNKLTKMAITMVPVASAEPTPVGEIVMGILLLAGVTSITLSQQKNLKRAVNDYIDNFGHAPTVKEVSVTTSTGQTMPLTEYTEQVRLDTKLPPITGIRIDTKEALVPPRLTTTLPAYTPPAITTKLPTLTPPRIDTKTPTLVPPRIDIPTMIVAGTAVLDNPAVGKVLTPGELDRLWGRTGTGTPSGSYITGDSIMDLDQKIFSAYSRGALSRAEYDDYQYARDRYLQIKTGVETSTNTLIQGSPNIQKTTLPKEVITAAIITGLMVIKKSKKREEGGGSVMPQVHQTIQAKIEDMTNTKLSINNQTLVDNLTKTAIEISTKTLERTGTKTDTQTVTQEGIKTVEQTVPETKTATQTATRTATAEATTTAEATAEAEREVELTAEGELAKELPIIPPPPDGGTAKRALKRLPLGTVMRKQGFGYWINEPGKRSYFTREKPLEFQNTNSNSPYDTLQVVGGKSPRRLPKQDMGIMDVFVANPPNVPIRSNRESIGFLRDPQFRTRKHKAPKFRQKDLGMGIVETRTKHGRRRHLRLT